MTPTVTTEERMFLQKLPRSFTQWRKDPGYGSVAALRQRRMLERLQKARLVRVIVDEHGCTETHLAFMVHRTEMGELAAFPGRAAEFIR